MRFYLKPTGSACYDKTGITFPHKIAYDLENMVWARAAKHIRWGRQFGWKNQPRVLTFVSDDPAIERMIAFAISNQKLPLIVAEKTW